MATGNYKPGDRPNVADQSITDAEYERRADLARRTDAVDPEGAAIEKRKREEAQNEEDRKKQEGIRSLQKLLASGDTLASLNMIFPDRETIGELKAVVERELKVVERKFRDARALSTNNAYENNYDEGARQRKQEFESEVESLRTEMMADVDQGKYKELLARRVELERAYKKALEDDDKHSQTEYDKLRRLNKGLEYYVEDGDTIEAARNNLRSTIDSQDARAAEKRAERAA